jgi:hypothetical protein
VDLGILSAVSEIGVTVGSDGEMTPRQSINTVIGSSEDGVGVTGNSQTSFGMYGSSTEHIGVGGRSSTGTGVVGTSDSHIGVAGYVSNTNYFHGGGVYGVNTGTGSGVHGFSEAGPGLYGESNSNIGVRGTTSSTQDSLAGVYGRNGGSGAGVYGLSDQGDGVYGESNYDSGFGVYGQSSFIGVGGRSGQYTGVWGYSDTGTGVAGYTTSPSIFEGSGVYGVNMGSGAAVNGWSEGGPGIYGSSTYSIGVMGSVSSTAWSTAGVYGENGGAGIGVRGQSNDGMGVYGESATDIGVYGYSPDGIGVDGFSETFYGMHGSSISSIGVGGFTQSNRWTEAGVMGQNNNAGPGVRGYSASGPGVYGLSSAGIGVYGRTGTGGASGYFSATNPSTATVVMVNQGTSSVLRLINGGASDGSGGGHFIEAVNNDGQDVQFRVTTSGTVETDGNYNTPAADFAEMLPAVAGVEPGDVLVIGADGRLTRSTAPYQATVVGVYSTEPGFVGGRDMDGNAAEDVPLAIVGVVPVKVSAENGAIQPGDLLVASATPAHAMRAGDNPPNGTVIGKALGSLAEGTGVIQMLVMLQ